MGEGLADGRPEGVADRREGAPPWCGATASPWRSAATRKFLHDGRARNLIEAVLWHGGVAQAARDALARLAPAGRAALLAFLEAL
jgi:CxxC motif-containing protein (DUF1111 family)